MSNFSKAMRRCGQVWLSMAKELYVEEDRRMKVIDVTETVDSITLMTPAISEIGEVITENDPTNACFHVDVDDTPASV